MRGIRNVLLTVISRKIKPGFILLFGVLNAMAFSYYIWDYYRYVRIGQIHSFFLHCIGNRHVLFIVSGIALTLVHSFVIRGIVYEADIRLRLGSHFKTCAVMGLAVVATSFLAVTLQFLLAAVMAICAGAGEGLAGAFLGVSVKVYINTFMYYTAVGMLAAVLDLYIKNKLAANAILVCLLVINSILGNSVYISAAAKFFFTGHIYFYAGKTDWLFWLIICGLMLAACLACPHFLGVGAVREYIKAKYKNAIRLALVSAAIFAVYAAVGQTYSAIDKYDVCNNIVRNFGGFADIDANMCMYLFYQFPLWIYIYNYLTERFAIYGIHYALKLGSVKKLMFKTGLALLAYVGAYYLIGLAVLLFTDRCFIGTNLPEELIFSASSAEAALLMLNLMLQSVIIILLGFAAWLKDRTGKHIGFIAAIMLHIILSVVAAVSPVTPPWIPLTQGVYYAIRGDMGFALAYQLFFTAAVCIFVYFAVIKEQSCILSGYKEG